MHRQSSTLLTLAFLLLPLSSFVSAGLDSRADSGSGSGIGSGSGSGSGSDSGNLNGNLNPNINANANANQNQNQNQNQNENYNQNTNTNTNTNVNINDNDNNFYNINFNNNHGDDDDDPSPHVVYTTEIVTALTTYCPFATKIEHNGITYTVTEASTLTITDCPCTVSHALPGLALTPAILPQSPDPSPAAPPILPGNILAASSSPSPSPSPPAGILPLPSAIFPPQSFPALNNAEILAASSPPSGLLPLANPAPTDTDTSDSFASFPLPSEVGGAGSDDFSAAGTGTGVGARRNNFSAPRGDASGGGVAWD
ncbi:hypothetical protein NHQ30_010995 [Ciborinia camelliae]|nr:hypothetical protein NHQ30_010995 [Ciborinia camelliae]